MTQEVCPTCGRTKPGPRRDISRDERIRRWIAKGKTPTQIGTMLKISRARAHQLMERIKAEDAA